MRRSSGTDTDKSDATKNSQFQHTQTAEATGVTVDAIGWLTAAEAADVNADLSAYPDVPGLISRASSAATSGFSPSSIASSPKSPTLSGGASNS